MDFPLPTSRIPRPTVAASTFAVGGLLAKNRSKSICKFLFIRTIHVPWKVETATFN